jgi:hypothetical protein
MLLPERRGAGAAGRRRRHRAARTSSTNRMLPSGEVRTSTSGGRVAGNVLGEHDIGLDPGRHLAGVTGRWGGCAQRGAGGCLTAGGARQARHAAQVGLALRLDFPLGPGVFLLLLRASSLAASRRCASWASFLSAAFLSSATFFCRSLSSFSWARRLCSSARFSASFWSASSFRRRWLFQFQLLLRGQGFGFLLLACQGKQRLVLADDDLHHLVGLFGRLAHAGQVDHAGRDQRRGDHEDDQQHQHHVDERHHVDLVDGAAAPAAVRRLRAWCLAFSGRGWLAGRRRCAAGCWRTPR